MKSAGVEFVEDPTDYANVRIATLKDPEGNPGPAVGAAEGVKLFCGWIVVAVGIVVTCAGFGATA